MAPTIAQLVASLISLSPGLSSVALGRKSLPARPGRERNALAANAPVAVSLPARPN
ncbi:hypothetical protein SAMN06297382_1163 [Amphiplicatus metriothermophilus]|uniref:Uncharacterized protein n=1 Tax=Amphiplicatus metriothermophilus TaxID=1519374 RepID=A0A239PPS7_9PROT|nr:hypothetical protein [Amphiplicatus metriothermophilus]SNT72130.1 hypothetical protein SAMN06297382_1163 [Amphiplicatus metriothermophilus]